MVKLRSVVVLLAAYFVVSPAPVRAEVILTPFAGKAFSGALSSSRTTYGAALGFLGGGVFGFEGEFSYVKDAFGDLNAPEAVTSNNVQSLSADVMAAVPARSVRLYASAGLSVLRPAIEDRTGTFVVNEDKLGYNIGGGLMVFLSDHVGLRGDLRYFKAFSDLQPGQGLTISLGTLDYWRGTVGLALKF
jgi:Outer membrane protein beta-barrel domain